MAKRVRAKTFKPLSDTNAADQALFEIAQLRTRLKLIDAEAEEKINRIKENAAAAAAPIKEQISALEQALFFFTEENKFDLFSKNKKTVELTFGFIGMRKSSKITVKKTTVEKLKEMELFDAIIIKETPNKDVLATYDDAILKQVDAKRVVQDTPWYEVKEEDITGTDSKVMSAA